MYYAGIGSRNIKNKNVERAIETIGGFLALNNIGLRSGAADGSDYLFEKGCDKENGEKEIFLPWYNFNGSKSLLYNVSDEAYSLASKHHPYWDKLKPGARKLIARNGYQILGRNLNEPAIFVICYTPKGKPSGGTAQGIKIAEENKIPIFNIGLYEDLEFVEIIKNFNLFYKEMREKYYIQKEGL